MERTFKTVNKPDWLGLAASLLAIAACYGTLAVLAILSLMGATLTLHEGAWAGAIVVFALLALAGIALGRQRHGRSAPTALALAGAALILWVMFAYYDRLIELAGFALLLGGAIWDWRLRKSIRQEEQRNG
jgi:arsenite methyltransferase